MGKGKSNEFHYKEGDEKRGIRLLADLFSKNKFYLFPADELSLTLIKDDIIKVIDISFERCSKKGYVEEAMLEELHNVAMVINGYCQKDDGEIWKREFNDFYIMMLKYAFELGCNFDKGIVLKLLIESGLLEFLSICIEQIQEYEYDFHIISEYLNDTSISVTDKHILCFMISKVCKSIREEVDIDIEELLWGELIIAIRTQYYLWDDKEKVRNRLLGIIRDMSRNCIKKKEYDSLVKEVIKLHIGNMLPIARYSDYVEYHTLYKLLYYPDTIDYNLIDLNAFVNVKSQRIIDNAKRHGGYLLYKRVRDAYYRNMGIKRCEAFRQILNNETYRMIYETERKSRRAR